jgi:hypothetical protein
MTAPAVWALTPDYSTPPQEKLAWKTDVLRAWDASEQRRALRIAPRRAASFATFMQNRDKQTIENQLFAWGALTWALPIWWDGQHLANAITAGSSTVLCDTVERDFADGGLAVVLTDASTYELLTVTSFTSTQLNLTAPAVGNWSAGAKLYPARNARLLSSTRLTREHGLQANVQIVFQITDPSDWPAATGLPTYRGAPVLEDSPDTDSTSEGTFEREQYLVDADTGALTVIDTALIGLPTNSHNWFLKGRAARNAFRELLYLLKGSQGELWVPSYQSDLSVVSPIGSADTTIECRGSGFGLFASVLNRKDIRIELFSGTVFYRRITGSTVDSPTTELVTISSALGVAVSVAAIRRVSFMVLSRLASDEVTISHLTAIDGVAISTTPFAAVNHDI